MNQSLTLQYFSHSEAPLVMGRLRSLSALTNVTVGGAIFVLARYLGYTEMFALFGAIAVVAGLWALTRDPSSRDLPPQSKKMRVYSRYWLYYLLTFMSGARRQIFVAFAVFLLVDKFNYTITHVTILFVVNNILNYFANPMIGRAVNRYGEQAVLAIEYVTLALVFLGYAYTESAWLAGALYVIDNIVFNFAMAVKTFYQKIARKEDIASGMAVGFTINHIAAVFIPALGGLAWIADYRSVFFGAVALSLISLALTFFIPGQLAKARHRG